jgi:hypothetical protein
MQHDPVTRQHSQHPADAIPPERYKTFEDFRGNIPNNVSAHPPWKQSVKIMNMKVYISHRLVLLMAIPSALSSINRICCSSIGRIAFTNWNWRHAGLRLFKFIGLIFKFRFEFCFNTIQPGADVCRREIQHLRHLFIFISFQVKDHDCFVKSLQISKHHVQKLSIIVCHGIRELQFCAADRFRSYFLLVVSYFGENGVQAHPVNPRAYFGLSAESVK